MAELSKYEQALAKYNCELDDQQVADAVKKIIAEKVHENDTLDVKKFLFGSIELTTLKTTDSDDNMATFLMLPQFACTPALQRPFTTLWRLTA